MEHGLPFVRGRPLRSGDEVAAPHFRRVTASARLGESVNESGLLFLWNGGHNFTFGQTVRSLHDEKVLFGRSRSWRARPASGNPMMRISSPGRSGTPSMVRRVLVWALAFGVGRVSSAAH